MILSEHPLVLHCFTLVYMCDMNGKLYIQLGTNVQRWRDQNQNQGREQEAVVDDRLHGPGA